MTAASRPFSRSGIGGLTAWGVVAALAATAAARDVPYLTGRVVDTAELLGDDTRARISALLEEHEQRTTNQIAVLTVPGLESESIEDFAWRVFEAWRLGQAGRDNGVLILVAPADRRMRIEVGYGLEDKLTDLAAGRIVRDVMAPRFKESDYDGGVEEGARAVVAMLEGDGFPDDDTGPAPYVETAEESPPFFEGPDLGIVERILMGAFIFGIIGLFTAIGIVTPGVGWFLYFFLIPFWAMFPIVVVGTKGALTLLIAYLVLFPFAKVTLSGTDWYRKIARELKAKGSARIGAFTLGGGGSGGSSWSSGSGGFSRGGSFSGGGGRSGGGGASGSW